MQAFLRHQCGNLLSFLHRTAEWNHHIEILQAIFFTCLAYRSEFQLKRLRILRVIITGCPAPAQQSARFMRFIGIAALQVTILAGFEIAEAQSNRPGRHRLTYHPHPLGKLVHGLLAASPGKHIKRMFMNIGRPDKFFTHQTNPIARQLTVLFRQLRISEIHIDFGTGNRIAFHSR